MAMLRSPPLLAPLVAALLGAAPLPGAASTDAPTPRADVRPAAVLVYAWAATQDPVPLGDGARALASEFDRPPSSYVPLDGFEVAETSRFPPTFDATVILANDFRIPPGRVTVSISVLARVGPFVVHPATGMTDVERGQAEAVWEEEPLLRKQKTFHLGQPRRFYAPTVDGLRFREAVDRLAAAGRWPFEIEVVAEVSCAACEKGGRVTRRLPVAPGD